MPADPAASPTPAAGCVLIAERNPDWRAALVAVVRQVEPEAEIVEALSGADVIDCIMTRAPDIAFVGMQLGDLSGPEAVAHARKRGGRIGCLLLLAGGVFPQWLALAQSLDAYEYLRTPIDPDHIGSLLRSIAVRRRRMTALLAVSSHSGRGMIARVLARSAFDLRVEESDCGRHALKQLRLGNFDIAFLDANLANIDALELACKAQPLNLPTRLFVMTPGDPEPIAQAGRYFGVEAVLRMPFYARDVDLALYSALGIRRPYLLNALIAPPAPVALLRIADLSPARKSA